ncbi:MAG: peptidyl-prolyl cis-trans isomerase [Victivallaceae bacterium]|nr:peptidyl-prolyl cis-trans isomerase [Victivallaceae bacterium]
MNKIIIVCITLLLMGGSVFAAPTRDVAARWEFLPEIVAEIDGRKMSRAELVGKMTVDQSALMTASRERLEALAKITLKQQIEKYLIARLMRHDGIVPSAELTLEEYKKTFAGISTAEQTAHLKKIGLTKAQLSAYWRQRCRNPAEQFRVAFTLWLKRRIFSATVADEEIETFYREHQDKFRQPERVSMQSIIIKYVHKAERKAAQERADDILALVRQGVDFNKQAEKYRGRVGDKALSGTFSRGVLPLNIEKAVFAMDSGQISDVINMNVGFVIIKVDKKLPAGYIPLDKVRSGLKLELKSDRAMIWFRKAMTKERAAVKVKSFLT